MDLKENAQIAHLWNFDGNARVGHKSGADQFEKSNKYQSRAQQQEQCDILV